MHITDGRGTGNALGVNIEGQAAVEAITASIEHHVNHKHGEAYHVEFEQSPTGADDCIVYIKNENSTDMVIEGVTLAISDACDVYFKTGVTGTPVGGTDVTPVNCNAGSGNIADGVFQQGADITGLSNGVELQRIRVYAAKDTVHHNFESDVIIPRNKTFAIYCSSATPTILGTAVINYHVNHELGV